MLTPKRERFVAEYLVDQNATQAAIRAGYSPATANEQGARLLATASVSDAVRIRMREIVGKVNVTVEDIVRVGWQIATDESAPQSARVSALALLAKRHPEFSDKHEVKQTFDARIVAAVAQLSDDDLRLLSGGSRSSGD